MNVTEMCVCGFHFNYKMIVLTFLLSMCLLEYLNALSYNHSCPSKNITAVKICENGNEARGNPLYLEYGGGNLTWADTSVCFCNLSMDPTDVNVFDFTPKYNYTDDLKLEIDRKPFTNGSSVNISAWVELKITLDEPYTSKCIALFVSGTSQSNFLLQCFAPSNSNVSSTQSTSISQTDTYVYAGVASGVVVIIIVVVIGVLCYRRRISDNTKAKASTATDDDSEYEMTINTAYVSADDWVHKTNGNDQSNTSIVVEQSNTRNIGEQPVNTSDIGRQSSTYDIVKQSTTCDIVKQSNTCDTVEQSNTRDIGEQPVNTSDIGRQSNTYDIVTQSTTCDIVEQSNTRDIVKQSNTCDIVTTNLSSGIDEYAYVRKKRQTATNGTTDSLTDSIYNHLNEKDIEIKDNGNIYNMAVDINSCEYNHTNEKYSRPNDEEYYQKCTFENMSGDGDYDRIGAMCTDIREYLDK